jgi:oligosaccharide repeat unit polymerase
MAVVLEVLFIFLTLYLLISSLKYGLTSPYFIVMLHLFLGCVVRYLYLTYYDVEPLQYFLPISRVTLFELCMFIIVFSSLFYFFSSRSNVKEIASLAISRVNPRAFYVAFCITFVFLSLYYLLMMNSLGGFSGLVNAKISRVSDNVEGLGYVGIFGDVAIAGSVFVYYIGKKLGGRYIYTAYPIIFIVLLTLVIQGGRGNLIQYVISLFIISDCVKGKIQLLNKNIVFIAVIFFVMATSGLTLRKSAQLDITYAEAFVEVNADLTKTLLAPFSLFDHYELSKEYYSSRGPDYGVFYLEQLTRPIPRSLWPGKPEVLGKEIRQEFWGDDTGGVPAGIIGEGYLSFSVFGIVIVSFFLAYLCSFLTRIYNFAISKSEYAVFVSLIVPYVGFNMIRTGLDTAFTRVSIYIFVFFMINFFIKYRFSMKGLSR